MATIEERAIEWAKSVSPWITKYDEARAIDYKIGALEQRKIDIDKACEFLLNYRQETSDGYGYIAGIVNDRTIEDFKKAMEE